MNSDIKKTSKQLLEASRISIEKTAVVTFTDVNNTQPYIPPGYTQLYYTPVWQDMDHKHRLRYIQLYGLRTSEMIMLFELLLVQKIMPKIRIHPELKAYPELMQLIDIMAEEEIEHLDQFKRLNYQSRPDLYNCDEYKYLFFLPSVEAHVMTSMMSWCSRWMAFPIWLLFFSEESTLTLARDMRAMKTDAEFGPIESNWLSVYVEHSRDENRHAIIDKLVFDICYIERNKFIKMLDGELFPYVLKSLMYPRGSGAGVRVINQLISEFPELEEMKENMIKEIVSLNKNPDFLNSLVSHRLAPRALDLFNHCPELNRLDKLIPNYVSAG